MVFVTHSIEEAVLMGDRVIVLKGRPSGVHETILVDLPRPRDVSEIRLTPAFLDLHREIWAAMKEEVLKAYRRQKAA